jgi:glycosyltransferase involved in cell wall biosynthesis
MRVLLVANTLPPRDVSGVGEQVLQLATGLEAAGHQVEVLGRGAGGARGPKVLFPLMVVPAFLRTLHRFRPDVVQVHESDGGLVALLTKVTAPVLEPSPLLAALLQVSYVEELKAVRPLKWRGRILGSPGRREWVFRVVKAPVQVALGCFTAWLSDVVLAPSRQTALEIERDYGVEPVLVLPNVTGGRSVERAASQDSQEAPGYLLFVGRLRIRKGVEVLLHAVARLRESGRTVRLVVAGDGEHRKPLESVSESLGLADDVRFLGGCDAGVVRDLMAGATALVVPSIYEGMPLVVLEAMESELPVVASTVSGMPEVVTGGESGWLVPPEDVDALSEALAEVLDDPQGARHRGKVGKRRLDERFRPEHAAKIWCEQLGRGSASEATSAKKGGTTEEPAVDSSLKKGVTA